MKLSDYTVKEIKSAMIHAGVHHLDVLEKLIKSGEKGVSTTMISMIVNGQNKSKDGRVEKIIVEMCEIDLEKQRSLRFWKG